MHTEMTRRGFLGLALVAPFALAACSAGDKGSTAATTESTSDVSSAANSSSSAATTDGVAPGTVVNGVLVSPYDNGFDTGKHPATIEVEGYGTIKLELNAFVAPITVSHFAELANSGFYDGLTFHRINDWMIQGGDPEGTGRGGTEPKIKGEFVANGVVNAISHKRGVISMARSSAYDSASSQFFIMYEDTPEIDEQYAAFGKVTEGMEVVDAIVANTPTESEMVAPEDQPVISSIRVGE